MSYDAILFDLDGTVIDSREDIARSGNAMLRDLGRPERAHEELYRYIGEGLGRFVARAMGGDEPSLGEDVVRHAMEVYRGHYRERCLDTTRPFEGVPEALGALRAAGRRLAIVTNKPEGFTRQILDGLELTGLFEQIVGSDTTPERKPDPAPVAHALTALGVDADRAILIGDSHVDVQTARNAGVALGVVTWGLGDPGELRAASPEHVFERTAELARLA